jgi:collagenase-like PrtC family protease
MRKLELLAPAKNLECGIAAIDHGADAVYIGASHHGARAAAANSVGDITQLCRYAHLFGAKVYVTVNTLIYEDELEETEALIRLLKKAGADALLVQDLSTLKMSRDMALHASTQLDTRSVEKVQWLQSIGFKRVVLARELSVREIAEIHEKVPEVELEVFVHGALCVSYSGVCYASQACFGRSANRGECAQFCRMAYDLVDSDGKTIEHQRHLLSLKDLCQIDHLEELADAGACSFKIEGRLKDVDYVKNVVAAYSKALDKLVARRPNDYQRASRGKVTYFFEPDLKKTFTRGFTTYFLNGREPGIASLDTPKAIGEMVGHVKELGKDFITVSSTASFANGDGLCFFTTQHQNDSEGTQLIGFRVNRAVNNRLYPFKFPIGLHKGTVLYRNHDMTFERILSGKTAERKLPLHLIFGLTNDGFFLRTEVSGGDENDISGNIQKPVSVEISFEHQLAKQPQKDNIRKQLSKLGNTIFELDKLDIESGADKYFIPSSILSSLRHQLLELLENKNHFKISSDNSSKSSSESNDEPTKINEINRNNTTNAAPLESIAPAKFWQPEYRRYPYLYNISNSVSREFYRLAGLSNIVPAFELDKNEKGGTDGTPGNLLMQCRHCIRYTLGYCTKRGGKSPFWHEPLYLRLGDGRRFRLEFRCDECQMNVFSE